MPIHPETAYAYVACGWQPKGHFDDDPKFWQSVDWESVRGTVDQVAEYCTDWYGPDDGGCIVKLTATFEVVEALNGIELPGVESGQRPLFE